MFLAIVVLKNGGEAEEAVNELDQTLLIGCRVDVALYRADNLLFVTGLPSDAIADDSQFRSIVENYGPVEKCFLMRNSEGHLFLFH